MPVAAQLNKEKKLIPKNLPVCLVSSAGSFLGQAICANLLAQNCKVIALEEAKNFAALEKFKNLDNFKLIEADLVDTFPTNLSKVDYIFHLAGVAGCFITKKFALNDLLSSSIGTNFLIKKAIDDKAVFVLASTIDVYYGALSGVSLEYYFGVKSSNAAHYSHHEAKRYAEALLAEYVKDYKLKGIICRVGHLYGPGMNLDGDIVGSLIKQTLEEEKLIVEDDGLEIIYPVYIGDVSYGFIKAAFEKRSIGKIFSFVDDVGVTVKDFANILSYLAYKLYSKELKVTFVQSGSTLKFPTHRPDLSNSKEILNWEPKVNLVVGLERTLEYFSKPNKHLETKNVEEERDKTWQLSRFLGFTKLRFWHRKRNGTKNNSEQEVDIK
ncbi:MAG: NAD-dependent epimerase/dehydratase family protein, partial [Nitrososphaerota archaeon]